MPMLNAFCLMIFLSKADICLELSDSSGMPMEHIGALTQTGDSMRYLLISCHRAPGSSPAHSAGANLTVRCLSQANGA